MTISSTTRKAGPFFGNDATIDFPFTFKVFKKQDVRVTLTDPTGADQVLLLDSSYGVTLNTNQDSNPGGTVRYPIFGLPLPATWRLTITGGLANTQPTDIQNNGGFYPQVVEDMGDRSTIQIQQLQEQIDRALKFSVSDSGAGAVLPPADLRANKMLGFDSSGRPTVLVPDSGSAADVLIQLAGAGGASFVGFLQNGVGAILRTVQDKLRESVSVKDFGARGDGTPGDEVAVQKALDAGHPYVIFPKGIYRWAGNGPTVRPGTKLIGQGAIIVQDNYDGAASSSVGIEYCGFRTDPGATGIEFNGLALRGPFYGKTVQPVYRSIGLSLSGRYDQYFYNNPNYPGNPPTLVSGTSSDIVVRFCTIEGWGQSGIIADQIDRFSANFNHILHCGRDGVRMYGVRDFDVTNNKIEYMAPGFPAEGIDPNHNVYGITATRIYHCTNADGTLTDYRNSAYGLIALNVVRHCPSWKALDTHGGTDITFAHNVTFNAHIAIGIDKGGFNLVDGYAPPRRIKLRGNTCIADPSNPAGNRCGIFAVAHDATEQNFGEDLEITGNHVEGYGEHNRDGNIVVSNYRRVVIGDYTIKGGLRAGINFQNTVEEYVIGKGVIQDIGITSFGSCTGINLQSANHRGMIDGAAFRKTDTADTMIAISSATPTAGYGVKVGMDLTTVGNVSLFNSGGVFVRQDSPFLLKTAAWGNINNGGSALLVSSKGIASVTKTATGVVRVVLLTPMSTTSTFIPMAVCKGTSGRLVSCAIVDESTIDVTSRDQTGAAVDSAFFLEIKGF